MILSSLRENISSAFDRAIVLIMIAIDKGLFIILLLFVLLKTSLSLTISLMESKSTLYKLNRKIQTGERFQ